MQDKRTIVAICAITGTRAAVADYPNVAAAVSRVLEYAGRPQPIIEYSFVLAAGMVEHIDGGGRHTLPLVIGGHAYFANAVRSGLWLGVATKSDRIFAVAESAMSIAECQEQAIEVAPYCPIKEEQEQWSDLAARKLLPKAMLPNNRVLLAPGFVYRSVRGPFVIERRSGEGFLCRPPGPGYVWFKEIDWKETAELNDMELPICSPALCSTPFGIYEVVTREANKHETA